MSKHNNKGTGYPMLIALIRLKGPQVDKTASPPRNGNVYVCTGTGVWSSGSNSPVKFGYTRKAGQWFTFYDPI